MLTLEASEASYSLGSSKEKSREYDSVTIDSDKEIEEEEEEEESSSVDSCDDANTEESESRALGRVTPYVEMQLKNVVTDRKLSFWSCRNMTNLFLTVIVYIHTISTIYCYASDSPTTGWGLLWTTVSFILLFYFSEICFYCAPSTSGEVGPTKVIDTADLPFFFSKLKKKPPKVFFQRQWYHIDVYHNRRKSSSCEKTYIEINQWDDISRDLENINHQEKLFTKVKFSFQMVFADSKSTKYYNKLRDDFIACRLPKKDSFVEETEGLEMSCNDILIVHRHNFPHRLVRFISVVFLVSAFYRLYCHVHTEQRQCVIVKRIFLRRKGASSGMNFGKIISAAFQWPLSLPEDLIQYIFCVVLIDNNNEVDKLSYAMMRLVCKNWKRRCEVLFKTIAKKQSVLSLSNK